jgi:hypothetical protein
MREGGYERRENEIIKTALRLAFRVREGAMDCMGAGHHCRSVVLLDYRIKDAFFGRGRILVVVAYLKQEEKVHSRWKT